MIAARRCATCYTIMMAWELSYATRFISEGRLISGSRSQDQLGASVDYLLVFILVVAKHDPRLIQLFTSGLGILRYLKLSLFCGYSRRILSVELHCAELRGKRNRDLFHLRRCKLLRAASRDEAKICRPNQPKPKAFQAMNVRIAAHATGARFSLRIIAGIFIVIFLPSVPLSFAKPSILDDVLDQ